MRIAIYYDNRFGRNDGPPLYYFNVLKNQMKLDVMHLIPEGDISRFGKFDYHFWVDWGEDGLPWKEWHPPNDGGETIYIASDTHLGKEYRMKKASKFDHVFFNQKTAAYRYKYTKTQLYHKSIAWLPHAAEPQAYPHTEQIKKYDVCFIGHFQDRKNFNGITRIDALDRLFREFPNFYFGTRNPQKPEVNMFEDAARKFNQSKIVFNVSIGDDVNMRVFETLSSGSFLLTNYLPTLGELFKDGKHLVTYKTLDEMVQKAKYYLDHDEEREKIAEEGHREFMKAHTYRHRIETIFETLQVDKSLWQKEQQ